MKTLGTSYRLSVPSWESDLRMLKRLRFVRNKIAHETGVSDCSERDLRNVKDFFARLVNREDPISLAENLKAEREKRRKGLPAGSEPEDDGSEDELELMTGEYGDEESPRARRSFAYAEKDDSSPPPKGCLVAFGIFLAAGALVLIVLALLNVI